VTVLVRYFAVLRERSGKDEDSVAIEADETVGGLYARLFPDLRDEDGQRLPVMYAVNQAYVEADHSLADGDEVAFIPPLGGGSGRVYLGTASLDVRAVEEVVSGPTRGGVCTFVGTVRNHHEGRAVVRLEYEAYDEMARTQMSALCDEAEARWPGLAMAMHHRLGVVDIGEAAVVVSAASAHRDAAFAACRWGIDTLKERVPIWKKEVYEGGATWKANAGSAPDASPDDPGQPAVTEAGETMADTSDRTDESSPSDPEPRDLVDDSRFGKIPGRLREAFSSERGRSDVNPYVNKIHELHPYVVPGEEAAAFRGRWRDEIGADADAPLVLEIGPGNGFFFRDLVGQRPDAAFVGVEIRYKRVWLTGKKARDAGHTNFRVMHQSFGYLDTYFDEGEITEVWINHPDPWPKDRHHKHRLLQPSFAALLASRVSHGGVVQVQSDFAPYGPLARAVFDNEMWEELAFTADLHGGDGHAALLLEGHIATNYERKKVAAGEPIMIARFRRTTADARPPTEEEERAARASIAEPEEG